MSGAGKLLAGAVLTAGMGTVLAGCMNDESGPSPGAFVPDPELEALWRPIDAECRVVLFQCVVGATAHDYSFLATYFDTSTLALIDASGSLPPKDFTNIPAVELAYDGKIPGCGRVEPIQLSLPIDWTMDPYDDVTWRWFFSSLTWLRPTLDRAQGGDFAAAQTA
ncbi:hypothetical protein ACFL6C_08040, partial [Myxococcota bacterium]